MPAKSQFDVVRLGPGDVLTVSGDVGLEREAGKQMPPTHVFITILQDSNVFRGDANNKAGNLTIWKVDVPASGAHTGAAQAFGLAVQFEDVTNGSAFETFAWMQNVDVKSN